MIIKTEIFLLLLMFINFSHCWVIGPALASTEYSKRLQQAQQLRSEKLAEMNETTTNEAKKVSEPTSDPLKSEKIIEEKKEIKNEDNNTMKKIKEVLPPQISKEAEFVQKTMATFLGKINNLSESDVIDPWKDDVTSLGLTINSTDFSNETEYEEDNEEGNDTKNKLIELKNNENNEVFSTNNSQNNGKESTEGMNGLHIRIHFKKHESFAERRARLCSSQLSPLLPKLKMELTPFIVYNVNDSNKIETEFTLVTKSLELSSEKVKFYRQIWSNSGHCRTGIKEIIKKSSQCLLIIGFVDNIIEMTKTTANTLIAESEEGNGSKNGKSKAVVRLLCDDDANKFYYAWSEFEKGPPGYMDFEGNVRTNEELFLKTVFVLEVTWRKGCILVFFDSRTINSKYQKIGPLLFRSDDGNPPKFGIKDGSNQWAASKFICGTSQREEFMSELNRMRYRNRKVPKELGKFEEWSRMVLSRKMDEEIFPVYQVTAPPPKNFFARLWDGIIG
uniref:Uncharacterized protein n=1 Tax=Meloidogyne hapla TaxID=6305 RepID=A0A1I8AZK4_MELHA